MKVGIDLLPLKSDPKRRGISNYTYFLIKNLFLDGSYSYEAFNCPEEMIDELSAEFPHVNFHLFNIDKINSSELEIFLYTSMFDFDYPIIDPEELNCKTMAIIYDLIPFVFFEDYIEKIDGVAKLNYFKRLNYIAKMDRILTMSNSAKADLCKIIQYPAVKIDVIYSGISQLVNKKLQKEPVEFQGKRLEKYILSVPGADKRKNIKGIITAYSLLSKNIKNQYKLVIANEIRKDFQITLENFLEKLGLTDNVIMTNYLSEKEINIFFANADILLFPSYYEGFGLPVIEAMAYGVPVITSNNSSLVEIASGAGELIDPANYSDIANALTKIITNEQHRYSLIQAGFKRIQQFTWPNVITALLKSITVTHNMVAMMTPWNIRCGIAKYSQYLMNHTSGINIEIFASHEPAEMLLSSVNKSYSTNWHKYNTDLSEILTTLIRKKIKILHIQFNFGLFKLSALKDLVARLGYFNIKVIATLHASRNAIINNSEISLREYLDFLKKIDLIIVHKKSDFYYLESLTKDLNIKIIPQGVNVVSFSRLKSTSYNRPLLSIFGFLLPHKGVLETILSLKILVKNYPQIALQIICALYPAAISNDYLQDCKLAVQEHKLEKHVIFENTFLEENQILERLAISDLILLPYKETTESSSASIRMCLAAKKPVIVSDIGIFDEFDREVYKIFSSTPENIAAAVNELLENEKKYNFLEKATENWLEKNNWGVAAKLYEENILSLLLQKTQKLPADSNAKCTID